MSPKFKRAGDLGRELARTTYSFGGRVSGIVLTVLAVRSAGINGDASRLVIMLAISTYFSNVLGAAGEAQFVGSLESVRPTPRRAVAEVASIGAILTTLAVSVFVLLSVVSATIRPVLWLGLPLLLSVPFVAASQVMTAAQNLRGSWLLPSHLAFGRLGVVTLIALVGFPVLGISAFAVAYLLAEAGRAFAGFVLLPESSSPCLRTRFWRSTLLQSCSNACTSANPTADRLLVGSLGLGSVVVYELADRAVGFFSLAITHGYLPARYVRWAKARSGRAHKPIAAREVARAAAIGLLLAPVSVAITWLTVPAVVAEPESQLMILACCVAFATGLPFGAACQVLVRFLILDGKSSWLTLTGFLQLATNVVLDIALGKPFGIAGVAAGSAINSAAAFLTFTVLLAVPWRRRQAIGAAPAPYLSDSSPAPGRLSSLPGPT